MIRSSAKRRSLSPKDKARFELWFKQLCDGTARYSDPTWVLKTYEFWEGIDDKPADILFAVDILEHQFDVHEALKDIKRLAGRCAFICLRPDFRGKDYWLEVIGQHFSIGDTHEAAGMLSIVANVKTLIPGTKILVAGTDETRWENIKANVAKYTDFVQESKPHGRRAIIACYGPSLKDTWKQLQAEAKDCDVISVSGSHDFLLSKGIIPRYHVECDPRKHKADNIVQGHPDVEYLLASIVHPAVFAKVEGCKIRLWHSVDGQQAVRIRDELHNEAPIIFGGGSVGLRSMSVMFRRGYRKLSIYGMDCSFSDDATEKWAGPHAQKENHKDAPLYRVAYNGRAFSTSPILLSYLTDFSDMIKRMASHDPSLEIRLRGDGLLQARAHGPDMPVLILPDQEAA